MSIDTNLKQAVLDELKCEPSIDAADTGENSKDIIITLSGNMKHLSARILAGTRAWTTFTGPWLPRFGCYETK